MGISPRTLRPSGFSPRSISGLALWLDASDSSTLFQNSDGTVSATASSDPVGYWADKSGNGRHAVQATAGSRPTVGSSSTAGKNAVRNNGTGSVALQVAAWPYTAGNTQFAVFNGSAINQGIYQRGSLNDEPRMAIQTGANGVASVRATRGGSVLTQTHSEAGYALSQWSIGGTLFNTALGRAYRDGVYGADTTDSQPFSGDQELRLLSLPGNIYGINGGIAEFLYYDRQLTATEVSRVAGYLSRRWGITLAPQVSNADAQDWINRVYQNGGSVSSATAASVNQLCDSLDSASLRDRFYRLNLFAGSNLNAALVPLYRGPSLGGTQYGGATDTNNAFVGIGTDYAETGATGGLTGNGTTKYLNTGLTSLSLPNPAVGHLSAWGRSQSLGRSGWVSSFGASYANGAYLEFNSSAGSLITGWGREQSISSSLGTGKHFLINRSTSTSQIAYANGSSIGETAVATTMLGNSAAFAIFARNVNGSIEAFTDARLNCYSIGAALSSADVLAYYSALNTFYTALGRA